MAGMNGSHTTTSARWRAAAAAAALALACLALAACRTTDVTNQPSGDTSLKNRGAPAPYVRGTVRPDGKYVRPYAVDK